MNWLLKSLSTGRHDGNLGVIVAPPITLDSRFSQMLGVLRQIRSKKQTISGRRFVFMGLNVTAKEGSSSGKEVLSHGSGGFDIYKYIEKFIVSISTCFEQNLSLLLTTPDFTLAFLFADYLAMP